MRSVAGRGPRQNAVETTAINEFKRHELSFDVARHGIFNGSRERHALCIHSHRIASDRAASSCFDPELARKASTPIDGRGWFIEQWGGERFGDPQRRWMIGLPMSVGVLNAARWIPHRRSEHPRRAGAMLVGVHDSRPTAPDAGECPRLVPDVGGCPQLPVSMGVHDWFGAGRAAFRAVEAAFSNVGGCPRPGPCRWVSSTASTAGVDGCPGLLRDGQTGVPGR